eukprot:g320.t1
MLPSVLSPDDGAAAMGARTAPPPLLDGAVLGAVGMFANWDGVYFVRIAEVGGYEFEQFRAFFPLLPIVMHALVALVSLPLAAARRAVGPDVLPPLLSARAAASLAGFIVANVSFVAAALLLLRGSLLLAYCVLYNVIGPILFCSFYPWT